MRALIVDDSRFVRGFLRGMLEVRGIACEEAADGRAALELLHGDLTFELALVDWNMPVMNGLEFVTSVRADPTYDDMVIVMVTTETETSQMLKALDAGANDYIMKPFTDEIIAERLMLLGIQEQTV